MLKKPIGSKEFKWPAFKIRLLEMSDVQKQNYIDQKEKLENTHRVFQKSKILYICPFVDKETLLQVDRRQDVADCLNQVAQFERRLPYKNIKYLSKLIVLDRQQWLLLSIVNVTVAHTCQKFWIILVKKLTGSIVGKSIT